MKNSIVTQCLDILKREDIKYELRSLFAPVINLIVYEISQYIYIKVCLNFLIFIMILAILTLLIYTLRNNNLITNIF